jgi:hypothetical protein
MFRRIFSRVFAVCLVITALTLSGCNLNGDVGSILGAWTSAAGDGYTINARTFVYDDGGYGFGYAGTIEEIVEINTSSGIIYFEYDDKPAGAAGAFNAIYYKDLTSTTVQLATAFNADYTNPATATLEQAKAKFTQATAGDFVSFWGAYTK